MSNNENSNQRITMGFLAAQAERIKQNILTAEDPEERKLWEEERKALADNLRKCYGDNVPEVNQILADLGA